MAKIISLPIRRSRLPRRLLNDGWWLETPPSALVIAFPNSHAPKPKPKPAPRAVTSPSSPQGNEMHVDRDHDRSRNRSRPPAVDTARRGHRLHRAGGLAVLRLGRSGSRWRCFSACSASSPSPSIDVHATRNISDLMAFVFAAGLLALIEDVSALSVIAGHAGDGDIRHRPHRARSIVLATTPVQAATIPFRGPFQLIGDLIGTLRHMKRLTPEWLGSLVAWIVPLSVFAVFLALFSSANPLIENRLLQINLGRSSIFSTSGGSASGPWSLCAIWPLMRRRIRRKPATEFEPRASDTAASSDMDYLLGVQAVRAR